MHSIRMQNQQESKKKEKKMKKIMFLLIVLSILLVACEATPAAPTVVPTDKPTEIPTKEPTPVPTEEPTIVPTQEPTPVPTEEIPESCPLDSFSVPEDITIDLGVYGEFELTNGIGLDIFVMHPTLLNPIREGEDVTTLYNEGGSFSFQMPSPGFAYTGKNTSITVDGEFWGEEGFAFSESGELVIPAGAQVMVETEGGFEEQESPIIVYFLSGTPTKADDISLPENATLSCKDLWQITINNIDSNDIELSVNTGHNLLFPGTEDDILGIKFPNSTDFQPYAETFLRREATLKIKGNGSITGFIFDLYDKD